MSLLKMEISCNKFQANVFDQSRCQNCFKSRELHATTREETGQVKPIYASWLCLAPEGLDFDNRMQRSRKWQRRFFTLYEHGCLQFALDELPCTIPQGAVNLHQCINVIDAEDKTGQKNTLSIITPGQEIYIRGDSKEIISGWCEQILVFRHTNEQRRRIKESRTRAPSQEEASAGKSVCSIGASNTGAVEDNELCNSTEDELSEETQGMLETQDIKQETFRVDAHQAEDGSIHPLPFQHRSTPLHSPEPWRAVTHDLSLFDLPLHSTASNFLYRQEDDAKSCANEHPKAVTLAKHMTQEQENTEELQTGTQEDENCKDSCFIKGSCHSMTGEECWTNEKEKQCTMCPRCSSRSQTSRIQNMDLCESLMFMQNYREFLSEKSVELLEAPQSNIFPLRKLHTVEVKAPESTMTPDLLNFKKGWLFMDDHGQWRKYWFVLSAHSLRYYFNSEAEEASQLVREIDLATCHRVTELHDQRNFGFKIWTHGVVYNLATVTADLRRNWIQALTKNIEDQNAPDVTSIPDNCLSSAGSGPDVAQKSISLSCPVKDERRIKPSDYYRRRRGHPKTSSWTDKFTQKGTREQERVEQNVEESIRRRRGRKERRQRFAIMIGSSVCPLNKRNSSIQENQQQKKKGEIEECWLQVEKMAVREEKRSPLYSVCQSKESVELEKLLKLYGKQMEKPTIQSESANQDYPLDHGHGTDWAWGEPTRDLRTEWEPQKMGLNNQNSSLTDKYQETNGLDHLKDLRRQQMDYPLSQSSSKFVNEPKRKSVSSLLHEGITSDKLIKSPRSLPLCQANGDLADDPLWTKMFSERTSLMSEDDDSDPAKVKLVTREAEFLTRQNETLRQRNQELVNQLAEADREIGRLKAELVYQPNGHQPELKSIVECLELELARSCGQLQEAQTQLAEMEDNLKDTHQTLQLKEAILSGLGILTVDNQYETAFPKIIDRLSQCVQVLEFKVSELGNQQWISTLESAIPCKSNTLLMKSDVQNDQKTEEDGKKNKMLEREFNISHCEGLAHTADQQHLNRLQTIETGLKKRSDVFILLLEVISQLAGNEKTESVSEHKTAQINPKVLRGLQLENDIWEGFVNTLKSTTSNNMENEEAACVLQSAKRKLEEVKMYLSAFGFSASTSSNPLTLSSNSRSDNSVNASSTNPDIIDLNDGKLKEKQKNAMWKTLKQHMEKRLILIEHVRSKLQSVTNNDHLSAITRQCHKGIETNLFCAIISVVMDIMAAYLVETLSQTVIIKESVAIQTQNQEMVLEENNVAVKEKPEVSEDFGKETVTNMKGHIKELEHLLSERLESLQLQHENDKKQLKAEFEQDLALLKKSHRRATEVLLLKLQRQQKMLQEEKERLLTEEVADCLTVIEAMKRAHSLELEKMQQKACQEKTDCGDINIEAILKNHSKEISALKSELDALSEQYTQKCLENVHLAEALGAEREALQQHQSQNLALTAHNQQLTNPLVEEIIKLSTVSKDGCSQLVHDREQYELMIKLQVKEARQEQEIDILKNDLHAAKMDQKDALERFHEIQAELNLVKEKTEQQISQLKKNLSLVYGALEESMKMTPATSLAY